MMTERTKETQPTGPDLAERIADTFMAKAGGLCELEWFAIVDVVRAELATSPELAQVREALSRIRDTAIAMVDSLRTYPRQHTIITSEGPQRIKDDANAALATLDALTGKAKP